MNYEKAEKIIKFILLEKKEKGIPDVLAFLHKHFKSYNWIGIYIVNGNTLFLGPWIGKQATSHTEIPIGLGVCGSAAQTCKTEIVNDVHRDKRYLACFLSTCSEIVVPLKQNNTIVGEIDIDSDIPNAFTKKDIDFLEKIADMLEKHICNFNTSR